MVVMIVPLRRITTTLANCSDSPRESVKISGINQEESVLLVVGTPVGWDGVVVEEAGDDLLQPFTLFGYRLVHPPSQFPRKLLDLCLHAVAVGPPLEEELAPSRLVNFTFDADVGFFDSVSQVAGFPQEEGHNAVKSKTSPLPPLHETGFQTNHQWPTPMMVAVDAVPLMAAFKA
jgi:hypothetical protein